MLMRDAKLNKEITEVNVRKPLEVTIFSIEFQGLNLTTFFDVA